MNQPPSSLTVEAHLLLRVAVFLVGGAHPDVQLSKLLRLGGLLKDPSAHPAAARALRQMARPAGGGRVARGVPAPLFTHLLGAIGLELSPAARVIIRASPDHSTPIGAAPADGRGPITYWACPDYPGVTFNNTLYAAGVMVVPSQADAVADPVPWLSPLSVWLEGGAWSIVSPPLRRVIGSARPDALPCLAGGPDRFLRALAVGLHDVLEYRGRPFSPRQRAAICTAFVIPSLYPTRVVSRPPDVDPAAVGPWHERRLAWEILDPRLKLHLAIISAYAELCEDPAPAGRAALLRALGWKHEASARGVEAASTALAAALLRLLRDRKRPWRGGFADRLIRQQVGEVVGWAPPSTQAFAAAWETLLYTGRLDRYQRPQHLSEKIARTLASAWVHRPDKRTRDNEIIADAVMARWLELSP